ncbi:MAG TPA: ABC transporter permease [Vicinamibacteria bacterium]|jgi:putative ABC transport system permease protein|nr:ABC transporter permease [Vicinamibacteria bacterium]
MALPLTYTFRNLIVRWKVTLLAVVGICLVVMVLMALLSVASGFQMTLRATGSPQNAIVVQQGSTAELASSLSTDHVNLIAVDSRVARAADGGPLASPEFVTIVALPRRADGVLANVTVRAVTPRAFAVRNGVSIVQGRAFRPGLYEVIVGKRTAERMRGLDLGSHVSLMRPTFEVVGVFTAEDSSFESEIWGDLGAMGSAFNRAGEQSSLTLRLTDPNALAAFNQDLKANPQFQLEAKEERRYYEDQAGPFSSFLIGLAIFVSVVMGIGALFGAMNTMYAIVAARTREIGTLRALGFSRLSVLTAFVMESILVALIGGVLGGLLAFSLDGFGVSTFGPNMSEIAFAFRISRSDWLAALCFTLIVGVLGGFLPALRASRLPITAALREG